MTSFKNKIIALCGFKGCGKDFVANYISETYNYEHLKISTKLKEVSKTLFDINDEQIEGNKKETIDERWNITPRQMLQFVGTDMFQYKLQELIPECERNFWIQAFVNGIKAKNAKDIVISDMRFLHEYIYLKKHLPTYELIVIRIDNSTKINAYNIQDTHISETEYKRIPIDFQITNNMTRDIKHHLNTIINVITY